MTADPAALVVEGGAMRGVFSTGVLDGFLARGFTPFDLFFGVSSGAGNLAAFLARMPGRNLKIYTDYSLRPGFINWKKAIFGGPLMDLDWMWEITIKEIRLDLETIYEGQKPFIVCLTDLETGKPIYKRTGKETLEAVLKAASALPLLYNRFPVIDGARTLDGGLSDPLPVKAAIRSGAKRIMVIRSRHRHYRKQTGLGHRIMRWRLSKYPPLAKALARHAHRYNEAVSLIRTPPPGVDIVEICPPETVLIKRLERNPEKLLQGYNQGIQMAEAAIQQWKHHES